MWPSPDCSVLELCFTISAEAMFNSHILDLMAAYDKTPEAFTGWAFTPGITDIATAIFNVMLV